MRVLDEKPTGGRGEAGDGGARPAFHASAPGPVARKRPAAWDCVSELVALLLAERRCSANEVARLMRVSLRTLQRRLEAEGASFADILEATRAGRAQVLIECSNAPLSSVAEQLGFSSQAAFNRWHKARFRQTPARRRAEAAQLSQSIKC